MHYGACMKTHIRPLPVSVILTSILAMGATGIGAFPAQAADSSTTIVFRSAISPSTKIGGTIGNIEYGVLVYKGLVTWRGESIEIERIVNFRYTNGDGPASVLITLLWPDGSRLAMDGSGFVNADAGHSDVFIALNVFGATGRWKGYRGIARQDCIRRGGVEAKSACTFVVKVNAG